jgi:uncharacterized flavoprotein (TIGR03862 family)
LTKATVKSGLRVAVVGGGPAGLMAAEVLVRGGAGVDVFDAMPSAGRKFLMAGRGGLNLTHAEAGEPFLSRYGAARSFIEPQIKRFSPADVRIWAHELGIETFVGSSGRVFPAGMKAAPLLRAWLHRLRHQGVSFFMRHRWLGWEKSDDADALLFATRDGRRHVRADATVLALGGASWPQLGSDGAWIPLLQARGVEIVPLRSANSGFDVAWSDHLRTRCAGQPVKTVTVTIGDGVGRGSPRRGEFIVTGTGVEGGLIYTLSAQLRELIALSGSAIIHVDLAPDWSHERLTNELTRPRGSSSWSRHLQRRVGLGGVKAALLFERLERTDFDTVDRVVRTIKALPLTLVAARPIAEAISSAGGVAIGALDERLMLRRAPGIFCAGEMLDWEAPTGGYLLTACFASGKAAGAGALEWLLNHRA